MIFNVFVLVREVQSNIPPKREFPGLTVQSSCSSLGRTMQKNWYSTERSIVCDCPHIIRRKLRSAWDSNPQPSAVLVGPWNGPIGGGRSTIEPTDRNRSISWGVDESEPYIYFNLEVWNRGSMSLFRSIAPQILVFWRWIIQIEHIHQSYIKHGAFVLLKLIAYATVDVDASHWTLR